MAPTDPQGALCRHGLAAGERSVARRQQLWLSVKLVPEDILVNGVGLPGREKPSALDPPGQLMPGSSGMPCFS